MITSRSTQTIAVNTNTLTIGRQVYQLRNLVRIQEIDWKPELGYGTVRTLGVRIAVVLIATLVLSSLAGEQGSLVWIVGISLLAMYGYRLFKVLTNTNRFAVIIETNGSAMTALISKVQTDTRKLFDLLSEAIENPPDRRVEWNFNNIEIKGDQINQHNTGPGAVIGKQVGKVFNNA